MFLVTVAAGATWVGKVTSALSEKGSGGILQVIQGIRDPMSQFPSQDKLTLLLVGKDYNRDRKGMEYTKNSRSDTIMLMSVDLANKKIGAVSIPRDTKVRAPDGRTGKINGTFARGGIELLSQTIEEKFGVHIDYHVIIKPDAVKEIVNSLGGVNVEAIDAMNYDDNWGNLHIHLPKGEQRITGEEAIGFTRFREVNATRMDERGRIVPLRHIEHSLEEGDPRRMARQQQLIRAMVSEANRASNLWKADQIIDTGFKQLDTNFKRLQLMALAQIFRGAGEGAIQTATLEGTDSLEDGAYYLVLDEDRAKATVDWLIKGDESAANRMIRIAVYNGTKTSGVARKIADRLKAMGYDARSVGNTKTPAATTSVLFHKAMFEPRAKDIQTLAGGGEVRKASESETTEQNLGVSTDDIIVVIGEDNAAGIVARNP